MVGRAAAAAAERLLMEAVEEEVATLPLVLLLLSPYSFLWCGTWWLLGEVPGPRCVFLVFTHHSARHTIRDTMCGGRFPPHCAPTLPVVVTWYPVRCR